MKTCLLISVYNSTKFLGRLFYCLHQLDPKPDITYFIENNSKDDTLGYIIRNYKLPYKIIRIWFREDAVKVCDTAYDTIAHIRQLLLTQARHYNADYSIMLDDDVYPMDKDFITRIIQWDDGKSIIGGTYTRVYPEGIFVASKWKVMNSATGYALKKANQVAKPFDMPGITSGGCLCLNRRIVQDRRLDFYPVLNHTASEDYGYCLKAKALGYGIILDNTAKLDHQWLQTSKDLKPWTMIHGKYADFKY